MTVLVWSVLFMQGGDLEEQSLKKETFSEMAIIDIWFRTDKAMVMYLSDGTLQVNREAFIYPYSGKYREIVLKTPAKRFLSHRFMNLCLVR